jgi:ComF family protein
MVSNGSGVMRNGSKSATNRSSFLRAAADGLLAVLIAPPCAACGEPLHHPTRGAVCDTCWTTISTFVPPLCSRCGDPLPSWRVISIDTGTCPRCRRRPSSIAGCRAIGPYEGSLRAIVQALKYDRRRSLAIELGRRMRDACEEILNGADLVVPVPLHARRRRARGFNQAADLARHLGLPVVPVLRRRQATPSQTDLPASRRHANVRQAFALKRTADVRGLCIVLVDDVSTTGATLEACARVLVNAGAREIRAVTAARVVSKPPG